MKKTILSILLGALSYVPMAQAQGVVLGLSPASIAHTFEFEYGTTTSSWGLNTFHSTFVVGDAVFVEDGATGSDVNGDPISQQGCGTLTNAAAISGKIALVRRGTCDFGAKAKKAMDAGAIGVIVVNNLDEAIPMAGGASGALVTIPVVSVMYSSGQVLTAAIGAGSVQILMGNKAGYFTVDLGITNLDLLAPHYSTMNTYLDGEAYDYPVGMMINNYGSSALADVKGKIVVKKADNTELYSEEVGPLTIPAKDSLHVLPGETNTFRNFAGTNLAAGEYTIEFSVSSDQVDLFPADNIITKNLVVSDKNWALMNVKDNQVLSDVASGVRSAEPPTTGQDFCTVFKHSNASKVRVTGMNASIMLASNSTSSLNGKEITGYLYKWNNVFTNIEDPNFSLTELEQVAFGEHIFNTNIIKGDVNIVFDEPVALIDNQRYVSCINSFDTSLYYGFSTDRNMFRNRKTQKEVYTILSSDAWYVIGFGLDQSMYNVLAVEDVRLSVNNVSMVEGKAYPNPANNYVNISVAKEGNAVISLTDLSGRIVSTQNVTFSGNNSILDLTTVNSGMYIVNVVFADGKQSKFNVVKN